MNTADEGCPGDVADPAGADEDMVLGARALFELG
jgi:hypothetical protein